MTPPDAAFSRLPPLGGNTSGPAKPVPRCPPIDLLAARSHGAWHE
jgi:hypothetical protein